MTDQAKIVKGKKTALVLGGTGMIGSFVLDFLEKHEAYTKVISLVRKKSEKPRGKVEERVVDFDKIEEYKKSFTGDDVFICLGTTMAKAGNKANFIKVDYTYVINSAHLALENGANQLMLVSSVGANQDSYFFYSKVKGKVELAIKKLNFWSIHIFQPSILLGERIENRWGEKIAMRLGRGLDYFLGGVITKYKPVEAEKVAQAMVFVAQKLENGIHTYPSHVIYSIAEQYNARFLR